MRKCAILYVGRGYPTRAARLLVAARQLPVLTVGEGSQFLDQGGAIGFVLENNRVRFDISNTAVQRSGLKASSKLCAWRGRSRERNDEGLLPSSADQQKLMLMIMATSIAVLVLASIGYIVADYYNSRDDCAGSLTAQADLIRKNSTAALQFLDPDDAQETLRTVAPNEHIRSACLYDARREAVFGVRELGSLDAVSRRPRARRAPLPFRPAVDCLAPSTCAASVAERCCCEATSSCCERGCAGSS